MDNQHRRNEADRAQATATAAIARNDFDLAEGEIAKVIRLCPDRAFAHADLGALLRRRGQPRAALACYARALALDPDRPAILSNLGNALRDLGRLDEAEAALRRAVAHVPDDRGFRFNLALLLRDRRCHGEAMAMLERLHAEDPANSDYEWDLALCRLYHDDFERGFAGYEARLRLARMPRIDRPGERWLPGAAITGKTVLLVAEQGLGDAIQFARFVPVLARRGVRVVLECRPELRALLSGLPGLGGLVEVGQPAPPHDLWAPLCSLPHLLGLAREDLPGATPYLAAPDPSAFRLFRPAGQTVSIGLVWAGRPVPRDRSWPLETLLPLLGDPTVQWLSLQVGPRAQDLAALGADRLMIDATPWLADFASSAQVMASLDLIITVDTAAAHLAGALGFPAWVLLRYVSDWRWGDHLPHSPWYPSLRLFRQADPADFDGPVTQIRRALAVWLTSRRTTPT